MSEEDKIEEGGVTAETTEVEPVVSDGETPAPERHLKSKNSV